MGGFGQVPPTGGRSLPPLVAAIRRFNSSTFILVLAIVYSLTLLLELTDSLTSAGGFFFTLLGEAPQILVCIGMWMLYASAKGRFSVTGYTLANVGLIIRLVEMILIYVLVFFVILVAMIGISQYSSDFGSGIVVGFLVGLIVEAILNILYLVKVRKVVTSSRDILLGQSRELKVSLYPIVILGIAAVGKLILFAVLRAISGSLGMMLWQMAYQLSYMLGTDASSLMSQAYSLLGLGSGFLSIVSSLLDIAVTVLFLIALVQYRGLGQTAAPYGGSGYPGQQPNQFQPNQFQPNQFDEF
jgi:F0F1-type ATP synthase assembly protein I